MYPALIKFGGRCPTPEAPLAGQTTPDTQGLGSAGDQDECQRQKSQQKQGKRGRAEKP
jgi:hypothetical protein